MGQDTISPKPIFWVIGGFGLIWNLLGVGAYIMLMNATPESLTEMYGTEQAAIMGSYPVWYNVIFALAVFGGVLGCILLLMRRKIALWPFVVSLICTAMQFIYLIFAGAMSGLVAYEWLMPILIPIIAALLVRHTLKNTKRGFLV